jgi:DNA-binding MarR family transcriptional regulator
VDLYTQVVIEVHRVQTLLFIRRNPYLLISPAALRTLSERLQIRQEECWSLIGELIEEGFVATPPQGVKRFLLPLRLTPVGEGLLDWVKTRSTILADPRLASGNPLLVVH